MTEPASESVGLAEVLDVAKNRARPITGEGDAKMLGLLLRDGECNVEISNSKFSVWYSWLRRVKPSSYFKRLAPGTVWRLMELGGVQELACETTFQIGPGTTGSGPYIFNFKRKWIRILCDEELVSIRVRDLRECLDQDLEYTYEKSWCERCNGQLRTPESKQCLHCGYDWH